MPVRQLFILNGLLLVRPKTIIFGADLYFAGVYYHKCTKHQFTHLLTATFTDLHIENSKNYKKWYCPHHTDCLGFGQLTLALALSGLALHQWFNPQNFSLNRTTVLWIFHVGLFPKFPVTANIASTHYDFTFAHFWLRKFLFEVYRKSHSG